jgi:hypothetical protein
MHRAALALALACAGVTGCSVIFGVGDYVGPPLGEDEAGAVDATADVVGAGDAGDGGDGSEGGDSAATVGDGAVEATSGCDAAPAPIAYWKLDEDGGSAVLDSSGSGITGTIYGKVTRVAGHDGGQALSFDGTSIAYVDFQDPAALRLTGSMTVSAWVNVATESATMEDQPILTKRALGERGWQLYISDGSETFSVARDELDNAAEYGPNVAIDSWHHLIAVYDASAQTFAFYQDGALSTGTLPEGGIPASQYDSTNDVHLGASSDCVVFPDGGGSCGSHLQIFGGLIDDVSVYGAALSACQVAAIP